MPETLTCEQCAKPFSAFKSDRVRAHVFCSLHCCRIYTHAQQGHGTKQTYQCAGCDALVTRYPSQFSGMRVFCSKACFLRNRGVKV